MKKFSVSLTAKEVNLGIVYIVIQLLALPGLLTWSNWILGNPLSVSMLNFIFFCINLICILALFHRFLWGNFKKLWAAPWRVLRYAGAGLLLYWFVSFFVNYAIVLLYPDFLNVNDQSISEMTRENYVLMSIGTIFFVPIVEETLYRGVVFGSLYQKSPFLGYVVSSLIFGIIHILSYIGTYEPYVLLLCFFQYIPAGLCLGWAYAKSDCIYAPILIHIAVNQIGNLSMR